MNVFEDVFVQRVSDRAKVCKKIKVNDPDIDKTVKRIAKYIEYFNSIPEFGNFVFETREFADVMIPNEFCDFITPKSVKYSPGMRQSTDLLIRESEPDRKLNLSFVDWIDLIVVWRSYFKKDITSDITSLATLKVDKSLADVIDYAYFKYDNKDGSYNTFVRYNMNPFVPIHLDENVVPGLFRDDYFNSDYTTIVRDYLSTVIY